jgi:hypothetical protein
MQKRKLLVRCPVTGRLLSAGASMDQASFENPLMPISGLSAMCPDCGKQHPWTKKDAILEET